MRIQKTLAKALGQLQPTVPLPSDPWSIPFSSSENHTDRLSDMSSCPLNQSPWDVYPNHQYVRSSFKCGIEYIQSLPNLAEEHKDIADEIPKSDEDVLGKKPTMETIEEKSHLSKRISTTQRENKRREATEKMENNKMIMCKKTDGRNWFCKQPAKLPYSYCEHHLRSSRSYYKDASGSGSGVGVRSKIQSEIKTFESDYCYYGTVVPFEGKRRRGISAEDGSDVADAERAKMDIISVSDEEEEEEEEEEEDDDDEGEEEE